MSGIFVDEIYLFFRRREVFFLAVFLAAFLLVVFLRAGRFLAVFFLAAFFRRFAICFSPPFVS